MNEEALKYAHELFEKDGYTGSLDDYKKLIESDQEALDYSYELFKKDGYKDDVDTFQSLLGVKKKEPSTQDSKTPSKPLQKSGFKDEEISIDYFYAGEDVFKTEIKTRENYIKELTIDATNAALQGDTDTLENIKANIENLKQALEEYKKKNNISSNKPKPNPITQKIQAANPIYGSMQEAEADRPNRIAREKAVKESIDKQQTEVYDNDSKVDINEYQLVVNATKSKDPVVAEQAKAIKEDKDNQLLFDYFNWMLKVKPEEGQAMLERKAAIDKRGDGGNLEDQDWMANQMINAVLQKGKAEYENAKKTIASMDNATYNKEVVMIDERVKKLVAERKKYENADSYMSQYKQFENEVASINTRMDEINNEISQYVGEDGVVKDNKYMPTIEALQREGQGLERKYAETQSRYAYIFDEQGRLKLTPQQEKANEITNEINSLIGKLEEVAEKTGVSQDKIDRINNAYAYLNTMVSKKEDVYTRFPELMKARAEKSEKNIEAAKIVGDLNMKQNAGGAALTGFADTWTSSLIGGIISVAGAPKVANEFLESVGIDGTNNATDYMLQSLYDWQANKKFKHNDKTIDYLEGEEKPAIVSLSESFGSGLGSLALFMAGGQAAAVTNVPKLAGLWGTAFAIQEADNYSEALKAGLSPKDASIYATAVSGVSATIELLVPDFKYLDDVAKASVVRSVSESVKKGVGVKEATKAALKEFAPSLEKYLVTSLKEGMEEGIEVVGTDFTKMAINEIEGREIYTDLMNVSNIGESILGGIMVGGFMTAVNRPTKKSPLQQELIGEIANVSPEQVAEISTISPENAGVIMEIQEVNSGLSKLPSFQALPKVEKNYILSEMMRKKQLQDAMKEAGIKDDATVAEIEKIELGVNAVLNGTPLGSTIELETKEGEPKQTMVVGEEFVQTTSNTNIDIESKKDEIEKRRLKELKKSNTLPRQKEDGTVDQNIIDTYVKDENGYTTEDDISVGDVVIDNKGQVARIRKDENGKFEVRTNLGSERGLNRTELFEVLLRQKFKKAKVESTFDAYLETATLEQTPTNEGVSEVQTDGVAMNTPTAEVVETTPVEVQEVGQESNPSVQVESVQPSVQEDVQNVQPNVQDALKDVESTAKALENINYDTYQDENYEDVKGLPLIYRGAGEGFEQVGFYSFDKTEAENYAQGNANAKVRSAMINPNAKILNMLDAEGNVIPEAVAEYERITGSTFDEDGIGITETMWGDTKEKKKLIKAGYDGIVSYTMDGNAFVAFNPNATIEANPKTISEAYHAAKVDGSNPELVQAVETLLSENTQSVEQTNTETVKATETVEENKVNQKAERAKQKVNDIAEKLKEKLKAKGIEDLNIKKLGVGSDELIDGLAKLVNALIDLGYSASDAIAEVLDSAKDTLGSEELQEAETALKAKITEGVDIDKAASELGVPKDVVENEVIRTLTIDPNEAAKNGEKVIDDLNNSEVRVQKVKSLIRALKSAEGLDQTTKDKLNSELGEFYTVLSDKELEAVGEAIIEEYGGLDAVIKDLNNLEIPPFIKVFALGQGIVQARKAELDAKTEAERENLADRQIELSDMLDKLVRDYGRAISYLRVLYFASPLAVVRKLKKEIEAQNKIYGENAKEKAQGILDLLDNAETTIDAFDSLLENADEALKLTIEEQQKEIDKLKTELSKLTKGGKGKPTTKKRKFTREGLKKKLAEARALASSGINHKIFEALGYAAGLAVEEGYYKFKDFYSFIRENFSQNEVGLDDIVDAYGNATDKAMEDGVDKKNFETREQVDTYLTEVEKLEKEIADKQRQLDIKKNIVRLGQFLSERLPVQKDNTPREQKIIQLALELDEATGSDNYSKIVTEYFGIVSEDLKQAQLERDVAKLEKSLEDKPKQPKAPSKPREQRLREEAARLDAEQGTNEFTQKVDEYFKQQAAKKEAEDLVKASENLAKKLADKPKVANRPTESANDKLLRAAQELDTKLGTNTHVKAVQDFINKKESQAKVASFGRLLSETTTDSKDRKKKEDVIKERAAELDKQFNTTIYTQQAQAYLEGKRLDKMASPAKVLESIEQGLIALGYGKEVERFSKKTGKNEKKTVVDWSQIVKGEKNPQKAWEKVDEALWEMIRNNQLLLGDYITQAPLLRDMFFANVNDRKVKAVQAELNKIARKGLPLNRARRKTRAEQLVEMYNTGALSNKKVRQAIAEDLGIVEFTEAEEKYLNDLIESIDKAQQGFEKEILEEELYNFFDSKKKGYLMRGFFESMRGKLLTGLVTKVKNLLGALTAANKMTYDYLVANIQSLSKGGTDAQIFRVTKKAQVMAATLAADIWWNGGVDLGSAFSETTGTKEGTPRIRYIEWRKNTPLYEAMGFSKISIMQPFTAVDSGLNKFERGSGRTLQAADAYNAINVQETSTYVYIKGKLKKAHPEWSNKTLLEKTWEVMYGKSLEDARAQAEQEYSDRGIILTDSVSDRIRFNRRVYEIIQQARGEAAVKAGQLAANRYTFKAQDVGVGSGVYYLLMMIKKGFNSGFNLAAQGLSKTNPKAADRVRRAGNIFSEIIFTQTLPFIKGVTNILEKRLELFPPYGVAKGIAYTVAAKLNQDNLNSSLDYARAGEYYWRAAVGGMMIILFKYLADDDEEGFEKIYAAGTPDWRDNAVESKVAAQNRIVINGRAVPFQAFGTNDLNLMIIGVINDMARENAKLSKLDLEKKDAVWLEAGARMTESILRDEYLKGFMNMYKGITQPTDTYWNRTLAEYMTRSVIPATGFFRQTFDMATKEQLKPVTFSEHLMKQSGLVAGWLLDRKAYDVLGKTYDNGSLYGNSTGSFMNMGSKMPEVEPIYKFLEKYKPILATKSSENETLDIMDGLGNIRSMDNVEFYDYGLLKSVQFGTLLAAYYSTNPESKEYKTKLPETSSQAYDKLFKEAVLDITSRGNVVNVNSEKDVESIETVMYRIAEEKAKDKAIAKEIGELNSLSYRSAFESFLLQRNLFVPYSVRGATEEYVKKLEEFE